MIPVSGYFTRHNLDEVLNVFTQGHLTIQIATQIILTLVGVGISLSFVGVILWAFVNRKSAPPQSFFASEMPVGNQISFNPGTPVVATAAAEAPEA